MRKLVVSILATFVAFGIEAKAHTANLEMICASEEGRFHLLSLSPNGAIGRRYQFTPDDLGKNIPDPIEVGEMRDCRLAGGRLIRLKTKVQNRPTNGPCGGEPDLQLSLWIDQRKVLSLASYYQCHGHGALLEVRVGKTSPTLSICTTRREMGQSDQKSFTMRDVEECNSVELRDYIIDEIEYPKNGQQKSIVGTNVEIINKRSDLCRIVQQRVFWGRLEVDGQTDPIVWKRSLPGLSDDYTRYYGRAEFDFDNDGVLDAVYLSSADPGLSWAGDAYVVFIASEDPLAKIGSSQGTDIWNFRESLETRGRPFPNESRFAAGRIALPVSSLGTAERRAMAAIDSLRSTNGIPDTQPLRPFLARWQSRASAMAARARDERVQLSSPIAPELDFKHWTPLRFGGRTYFFTQHAFWTGKRDWALVEVLPGVDYKFVCYFHVVTENY